MDSSRHVAALADEGHLLVDAAARAGLDASVPACPDWRVRDLLAHIGMVHRWATSFVARGRTDPPSADDELASAPGDDELLGWVADGHSALVTALRDADPSVQCWSFLPAPSPLAFWARRQAHETTVHRVDAESATGVLSPIAADVAVDGIDELLLGFFARRRGPLVSDRTLRLGIDAVDADVSWSIEIRADGRSATRGPATGDCVVAGDAADLYLLLWNRRPDVTGLDVSGDRDVLALWRERAHVTWS